MISALCIFDKAASNCQISPFASHINLLHPDSHFDYHHLFLLTKQTTRSSSVNARRDDIHIRAIFPNLPDVDRKIQLHKALCVPYGNS